MSSGISCTFEEFKRAGKELLDGIAVSTNKQVANGVKMLAILYLNIQYSGAFAKSDEFQAPIALRIILMEVLKRRPDYLIELDT